MKAIAEILNPSKLLLKLELDNKKITLIILICALIFYLDISLVLKGQFATLKKLESMVAGLKNQLEAASAGIAGMQELKKTGAGALQAGMKPKKIIFAQEINTLLQEISDAANKNALKLEQIRPLKESQAQSQNKIPLPDKFQLALIAVELSGDYHSLGRFINELEGLQAFIGLQSAKINSQPSDPLKQRASLILKTYVRK